MLFCLGFLLLRDTPGLPAPLHLSLGTKVIVPCAPIRTVRRSLDFRSSQNEPPPPETPPTPPAPANPWLSLDEPLATALRGCRRSRANSRWSRRSRPPVPPRTHVTRQGVHSHSLCLDSCPPADTVPLDDILSTSETGLCPWRQTAAPRPRPSRGSRTNLVSHLVPITHKESELSVTR